MALKYAQDYFNSCGVTSYYLEQEKIVDAQFLSISELRRQKNMQPTCRDEQSVGCQGFAE